MLNHIYRWIHRLLESIDNWACHPRRSIQNYYIQRKLRVQHDTEIVIDGFPRSANTFAVLAFEKAQNRKIKIAHHNHSEKEIIKGINMGIPVCVLIRKPIDAIKSYVLRHPEKSDNAVENYISMYRQLEPYFNRIIIALFDDVITDFGAIINKINQKYGTTYLPFNNTKKGYDEIFMTIKNINKSHYGGEIKYLAAPNDERSQLLITTRLDIDNKMLKEAEHIYNKYVSEAQKI